MKSDAFVTAARMAASHQDPREAIVRLMAQALSGPLDLPEPAQDETCLFEDPSVSIWHERFHPEIELPPHDHGVTAVLGVYRGQEENRLWTRVGNRARAGGTLRLSAGEIHVFAPDDIHSVRAIGGPSFAVHVYLGPLSQVERSLFDWETGAACPMTEQAFAAMIRRSP